MSGDPHGKLCCSFCGKAARDVVTLIAGPGVFICDECTELCSDTCRARREGDLDSRARAESAEWLGRITALRWIVEALSSGDATMDKPIRGPWSMRVQGDLSEGSVRIVLRRESKDDGDICIAFTETAHDLVDIAAWVAAARSGAIPSRAVDKWVEEGVEMTLSISAKALLREHERIAEQLRLEELLRSPAVKSDRPLPLDVDLLRLAVARIIERNPDHRRHIARVLRDFVNELTSVR